MKILFCGGGTGGHLFPIIAIARELRRLAAHQEITLHYIGPSDPLSLILLEQENFKIYTIASGKIRSYFSFQNIIDVAFNIPLGFLQSFFYLAWIRPRLVFCKGGTGAAVVVACASILGIPIFLHESDTVPGSSNKLAYKWAKKVFISFQKTAYFDLSKTILTGNPIEKELLEGSSQAAAEIFDLTFEKPILLFLGGSQGSQAINDFVLTMVNDLLQYYEVIHVCGKKNYRQVQAEAEVVMNKELEKYYHVEDFLNEIKLKHAYKVADFIISRAGSGSIVEIAALGKPSILIPLPSAANDHQSINAYEYAKTGAAIVMEQENLNPHLFLSKITSLLENPEQLAKMKNSALAFAKPLAGKAIAREILEYFANRK